jgi:hypothetical protein
MFHLIPAPLHRALLRIAHRLRKRWLRLAKRATGGVTVIGLDEAGRVFLVRHSYGSGRWALPGGGLGRGEQARDRQVVAAPRCGFEQGALLRSPDDEQQLVGIEQRRDGQGDAVERRFRRQRVRCQAADPLRIVGLRVRVGKERGDVPIGPHAQPGEQEVRQRLDGFQAGYFSPHRLQQGADAAGVAGGVLLGHDSIVTRPDRDPPPVERLARQFGEYRKGRAPAGHCDRDGVFAGGERAIQPICEPVDDGRIACPVDDLQLRHSVPIGQSGRRREAFSRADRAPTGP